MAVSEQEHVAALSSIQLAAYDSERWDAALGLISRASGGWAGQLLGVGPNGTQFNFVSQFPDIAQEFELRGGADPTINPRARIFARQPNLVFTDAGLARPGEIAKSSFFQDFLYVVDSADICLARLPDIGSTSMCACVLRSSRQGAFEREQLNSFAAYLAPMRQAIGFAAALEERGAALVAGAFSLVEYAAILVDATGSIVGSTPRAESLLRTGRHVISRDRRLHAQDRSGDVALQNALRVACAKPGLESQFRTIALVDGQGHPVMAHVAPLPIQETALRFGPVAVVIIKAPDRASAPKWLRRLYGLSASEAAIAMLIADGVTVEGAAQIRQVSVATLRGQLKSIFHKMGIHRQADLVRTMSAFFHSAPP